jgi:hypothetical protein
MHLRFVRAAISSSIIMAALATPVAAQSVFEFSDTGTISPSMRSDVQLSITVNCSSDPAYPTGTAVIDLAQQQRERVVTGSGTTEVTCDGVTRTYPVLVNSADGTFRKGAAAVSGQVSFLYTLCIENEAGERSCTTFTQTMTEQGHPIELRVGR